jgi:autotransporter translocation and assembly factor TamB
MRKSLSQYLFSPIAIIQVLLLSVLLVLTFSLTTPLGPALIEKIIALSFKPLEIKGFRGSFLTDLKIESLKWKDSTTTVELEQIEVIKPRYNIEKNQLHTGIVRVKRLVIRLPESDDSPSEKILSLPDFALPLNIKTNSLAFDSFEVIRENEVIFQIKNILLTQLNINQGKLNADGLNAQLILIGSPLTLTLQNFTMNMNQPHDMQGRGTADFNNPQVGKAKADFELDGTLTAYDFKLKAYLENKFFNPQTIQLRGTGDYDQITFKEIQTDSLDGNVKGKAEVKWTPELTWLFDGKVEQVTLGRYLPEWPAKFDATLNYKGGYNKNLYGILDLEALAGTLKEKKISANGKIEHQDNKITLHNTVAHIGQNKIEASGKASPPFDLIWDINANDLNQILPDLSGKLMAKGTLKGSLEQPILNAKLDANKISYQHYKLGSANLIAASKQGVYSLRGELKKLNLDKLKISNASLDASGTIDNHRLKLHFTHPDAKVKLQVKGGWKDPQWQGTLQQLELDTRQVSKWKLKKSVQITASKNKLKTSKFCLSNQGAQSCSHINWLAKTGVDIKGDLKRTPLALLKPFLPKDIQLQGSVSGRYEVKQKNNKILADVALQFPKGSVSIGKGKNKQRVDYQSLILNAMVDGQKITANTKLLLKNKGELTADANILFAKNGNDHQIDAKGKLIRIPLIMAQPWLPNDIELNGRVNGSFKLKQKKGKTVGDVALKLPASSVSYGEKKQKQRLDYQSLTLKAVINGRTITANTHFVLKNKGELTADANILLAKSGNDHQIDAKGKLIRIPLVMAQPWLPNDIQLNGRVNGYFKLKQKKGKAVGDVALKLPASSVSYGEGKQKQRLDYQSLTLKAIINGKKITANTHFVLKNKGELTADVNILLAKKGKQHQIETKGKLKRIPLVMARPWLPKDIQLNGRVNGRFKLKQKKGKAIGDIALQLPASSVLYGQGRYKQRFDYQSLSLNAVVNGKKITANTKLLFKNKGEMTANANVTLADKSRNHRIKVNGKLNRIPLVMARPWLPKELQLNGHANGRFNLEQKNGQAVGDASLQFPASAVLYGQGKQKQRIDYQSVTLKAIINGNKINANTRLILRNKAELSADATINLAEKGRQFKINSKGKLNRLPLTMLKPWLPNTVVLKGRANGQFKLQQINGKNVGDVALQLPASSVIIGAGKTREQIAYQSLTLRAIINGNKITANTRLLLRNKGELTADANINLDKKGSHHQINAKGKLNRIPLVMAKPWLPPTLKLNGSANGSFKLKQARGTRVGNLLIQLPNSSLIYTDEAGGVNRFNYQNTFIKASVNNKTVITNAKMQLNNRGNFSADAKILLGVNRKSHRIQGKAMVNIPNINWMQSFVPQTTHLRGRVTSNMTFNGRLFSPKISGQVALQDASLKLPKVGTYFRNINLSIKANNANKAIINGTLISGKGKAILSGFISLRDLRKLNAEMKIKGSNLQFINTHEALALMNPDISIKVTPKTVDILGKIHIPNAKITLNAIPESSVDESNDVIVMGEKKADGSFSAVKIHPNLIVSLGKQVKFKGFGLDTKLSGSVRVTHDKQAILTQGSIKISEGRYEAYGQNLTINDGRLVFNGPPTHVGMDVKAMRQIEDISAGIHLTGTLQQPKTQLFSTPSLSESNILSYLLTGHSMADITGSQTALLMQAVRSLNVVNGDGLMRNIGNSLGLDDLSLVPKDDLKKSELRLGKNLGSGLYVRYIVGIFDAMQKVALEYKVNRYLNLEAQAGADAQSLDFIYKVETD